MSGDGPGARNEAGIREAFRNSGECRSVALYFSREGFQLRAAPRGKREGLNNRWHTPTRVARIKRPPPARIESIDHADRELDERTIACGLSVAVTRSCPAY